jgi:hypothetical protein
MLEGWMHLMVNFRSSGLRKSVCYFKQWQEISIIVCQQLTVEIQVFCDALFL